MAEGEEIQFTLTRTGQGDLTVTVELTLQGDFFAADQPTQTTATFGPSDTEVTIAVPTQDDELDEADGAVSATLAEGTGYTIGDPASATTPVTDDDLNETPEDVDAPGATTPVTDDDLSVVSVERVQETRTEGEEIQFTLTRTGQGDLTVTVELTLQGDFFAADQPTQMTATFGPSDTEVTVSVPTQDDELDEADGAVSATLAEGAGYTIGDPASATTTVTDDDLRGRDRRRSATDQESVAEGEEIQFTLTRTGQGDLTVTVELTLQGDFFAADQPTQMTATFGPRTQRSL